MTWLVQQGIENDRGESQIVAEELRQAFPPRSSSIGPSFADEVVAGIRRGDCGRHVSADDRSVVQHALISEPAIYRNYDVVGTEMEVQKRSDAIAAGWWPALALEEIA